MSFYSAPKAGLAPWNRWLCRETKVRKLCQDLKALPGPRAFRGLPGQPELPGAQGEPGQKGEPGPACPTAQRIAARGDLPWEPL